MIDKQNQQIFTPVVNIITHERTEGLGSPQEQGKREGESMEDKWSIGRGMSRDPMTSLTNSHLAGN